MQNILPKASSARKRRAQSLPRSCGFRARLRKISLVLLPGFLAAGHLLGSDHIDGPVTTKHAVTDLTDLFAFPTPNTPDSLTLILDAYPFVPPTGHFPERVSYNFIIRKAKINPAGTPVFQTGDEVQISCQFVTPHDSARHTISCKSTSGLQATGRVNDVSSAGDFKLFAGMRSDPFFFNGKWALSLSTQGVLLPPQRSNSMTSLNILSIVIDIETSKLFGDSPGSLFAVAANTTTQDDADAPVRPLDRIGRPEITNVSLVANGKPDLRDIYNMETPFNLSPGNTSLYRARLEENITFYDRIDGKVEWPESDKEALANLLLDDFLVIDLEKPSRSNDFLEIEMALLQGRDHLTCGGRKPTDDIMDTLLTYYINRHLGPEVRDGVDKPEQAISDQFPYLAPPSSGLWARAKAAFARWYFGR